MGGRMTWWLAGVGAFVAGVFAAEQAFELDLELVDIFEVAVDAGEADVGDGVDVFETHHDEFTDLACGAFAFGRIDNESFGLVHDVFERSRRGDDWATQVLEDAFRALGGALAPWFTRFEATAVAFGGAMTGSWDLILPPLRRGLITAGARLDIALLPSADTERSALVGAATYAHPVHA